MLEHDIETEVVWWAEEELGGFAPKLKIENERGFPDRTLFLPDGKIVIPELKRPKKNNRSINQKKWVRRLASLGFATGFCESLADVKRLVERHYG